MKLGLDARGGVTDELLSFGAQLGATDVIGGGLPQDAGYWEYLDLLRLRTRVEAAGMRLYAIENLPQQWMEKIKLGLPGRDEQLGNVIKTLRNMGAAGIPVLGYNFMRCRAEQATHGAPRATPSAVAAPESPASTTSSCTTHR